MQRTIGPPLDRHPRLRSSQDACWGGGLKTDPQNKNPQANMIKLNGTNEQHLKANSSRTSC